MNLRQKKVVVPLLVVLIGVSAAASYLYAMRTGSNHVVLPPGCVKPEGGFLIVASIRGYNDSVDHAAPWPLISVQSGTTVKITICNIDHQPHGFQVAHFFAGTIVTVSPGQVLPVSFVANQVGTFRIYCSIFCTVHSFMQQGELVVTAG
ncbi:MAG: hypothetical protein HY297_04150 [Thaumarchaeota archaeon]|nr:hypothetical protein [Nitrososphaerota archaeon]